jgi:hypothetical protein
LPHGVLDRFPERERQRPELDLQPEPHAGVDRSRLDAQPDRGEDRTAPSSTLNTRSTSAMKSGWPGVSIRLTVTSSMTNDTTADWIVMPRCRSSAKESVWVLPASTLPISSMTPAA